MLCCLQAVLNSAKNYTYFNETMKVQSPLQISSSDICGFGYSQSGHQQVNGKIFGAS